MSGNPVKGNVVVVVSDSGGSESVLVSAGANPLIPIGPGAYVGAITQQDLTAAGLTLDPAPVQGVNIATYAKGLDSTGAVQSGLVYAGSAVRKGSKTGALPVADAYEQRIAMA